MKEADQLAYRFATMDDLASVVEVVKTAYTPYIESIGVAPGPLNDDYEVLIRDGHVRVAVDERHVIVGVYVAFFRDGHVLLDNAAILPRWQNKGIAQKFLDIVAQEGRKQGYSRYRLYTHAKMTKNIAAYEHLGFKEVERKTEKGFDRVYMEKTIE